MLPSDCTFDHKKGIELYTLEDNSKDKNYYSIDLSAATDRMPRILQSKLVEAI